MSEIVVANVFFSSDKQTGIIGGTTANSFTFVAQNTTVLVANSSGLIINTPSFSVGNSTVNTSINSSSIAVISIIANGAVGTANQVLTSNGTGIYWANASGGSSLTTYSANVGNGSSNSFTVSHNLNSYSLLMTVRENSTGYIIYPDLQQTTSNNLVISFVDNPTANQYALLIAKVT